jgi:hypothetical protein
MISIISAPSGLRAFWRGTGIDATLAGTTPFRLNDYVFTSANVGDYDRYAEIRDASGNVVCTTNHVSLHVH